MGILARTAAVFCAVMMIASCISGLSVEAGARANIADYLKGPNEFYPGGHDVNGSPVRFVIDTVGWNATSVIGNVGIGNGSIATFDSENVMEEVDYPDWGFMSGEVTIGPRAPRHAEAASGDREKNESATAVREENNATSTGNNSSGSGLLPGVANRTGVDAHGISTGGASNGSASAADSSTEDDDHEHSREDTDYENATYALGHPVTVGRPVKDLLYEHPLATPGTAYCELLGFRTPAGDLVNVGMKCTGYGY